MKLKEHQYKVKIKWTGNLGQGTSSYTAYSRNHEIEADSKPLILCSSDPTFKGDPSRYNPEDLFVSTLSSCHMLWYLHLCSINKITVLQYEDNPVGTMVLEESGKGHFKNVILYPSVVIREKDKMELAKKLHQQAHDYCFIANSVSFKVNCQAVITNA